MTSSPEKQWRIDNASHLKGVRLQFRRWTRKRPDDPWDHDHCAACWAKLAEFGGSDVQHEGFTTCDDYPRRPGDDWICQACFADLREDMEWTVAGA